MKGNEMSYLRATQDWAIICLLFLPLAGVGGALAGLFFSGPFVVLVWVFSIAKQKPIKSLWTFLGGVLLWVAILVSAAATGWDETKNPTTWYFWGHATMVCSAVLGLFSEKPN